jgi:hypothetical protein
VAPEAARPLAALALRRGCGRDSRLAETGSLPRRRRQMATGMVPTAGRGAMGHAPATAPDEVAARRPRVVFVLRGADHVGQRDTGAPGRRAPAPSGASSLVARRWRSGRTGPPRPLYCFRAVRDWRRVRRRSSASGTPRMPGPDVSVDQDCRRAGWCRDRSPRTTRAEDQRPARTVTIPANAVTTAARVVT